MSDSAMPMSDDAMGMSDTEKGLSGMAMRGCGILDGRGHNALSLDNQTRPQKQVKRAQPRSDEHKRLVPHNGQEHPEQFAAANLELDSLRAMLGMPSTTALETLSQDETEASTD